MIRTSDAPWQETDTIEKWRQFLLTDWDNPSRRRAYELIEGSLARPASFCEIGFGNAYDFGHCFQRLHDQGRIDYTGLEHTENFVKFARLDYPGYDFQVGEFIDLKPRSFDVTYTRHTLQHADPQVWRSWVRKMLNATRYQAWIVWHLRLGEHEHADWTRAWNNSYRRKDMMALVESCGFISTEYPVSTEDEIQMLSRIGR